MAFMNVVRNLQAQMKSHMALAPLAVSYGIGAALASGIMIYTSVSKADVSYNRWWNPIPHDKIDPTKVQQKLFVTSISKPCYQHDFPVEALRQEIYEGRDWNRDKPHH
ncbi:uncharacterized protein LOC143464959 [Clavelina lepadiformis]|uniref:Uncharacterized protein n=1 Tax=Clavelina lepadiformis TaxID=159417 RepID=A0ABP0FVY1_CLALP